MLCITCTGTQTLTCLSIGCNFEINYITLSIDLLQLNLCTIFAKSQQMIFLFAFTTLWIQLLTNFWENTPAALQSFTALALDANTRYKIIFMNNVAKHVDYNYIYIIYIWIKISGSNSNYVNDITEFTNRYSKGIVIE